MITILFLFNLNELLGRISGSSVTEGSHRKYQDRETRLKQLCRVASITARDC